MSPKKPSPSTSPTPSSEFPFITTSGRPYSVSATDKLLDDEGGLELDNTSPTTTTHNRSTGRPPVRVSTPPPARSTGVLVRVCAVCAQPDGDVDAAQHGHGNAPRGQEGEEDEEETPAMRSLRENLAALELERREAAAGGEQTRCRMINLVINRLCYRERRYEGYRKYSV